MNKTEFFGAIDIGGTKINMGIINRNGIILEKKMFLTPVEKSWEMVLQEIAKKFTDMVAGSGYENAIKGIGVGCPGTFDRKRQFISFAPNLKWRNVPIKIFFAKLLPYPVWFENDTNLSTLGISRFGEGKNIDSLVGVFIGTGIGGGIILDGQLYSGDSGGAGEVGHIVVQEEGPLCGCGNKGCVEAIASTTAIHNSIQRILSEKGTDNSLRTAFQNNENKSAAISIAYRSGNASVVRALKESFHSLGISIINIVNTLNPEMVVFGGGLVDELGELIVATVKKSVKQYAMPGTHENLQIIKTELGGDAPLYGGAALVEASCMQ